MNRSRSSAFGCHGIYELVCQKQQQFPDFTGTDAVKFREIIVYIDGDMGLSRSGIQLACEYYRDNVQRSSIVG
jgi:hypothetical protein